MSNKAYVSAWLKIWEIMFKLSFPELYEHHCANETCRHIPKIKQMLYFVSTGEHLDDIKFFADIRDSMCLMSQNIGNK